MEAELGKASRALGELQSWRKTCDAETTVNYEIIVISETGKTEALCFNGIDTVLAEIKNILSKYGMKIKKIKSISSREP